LLVSKWFFIISH